MNLDTTQKWWSWIFHLVVTKVLKNFSVPILLFIKKSWRNNCCTNKEKLSTNHKLEDLLDNWDVLGNSKEILNLVGCVTSVGEKDIYIGLNSRKYSYRLYEHSNKFHKEKKPAPQKVLTMYFSIKSWRKSTECISENLCSKIQKFTW